MFVQMQPIAVLWAVDIIDINFSVVTEAKCCKSCLDFRSTLRAALSRHLTKSTDRTSASSHAPYCSLTSAEKDARLSNLHHSLVSLEQQQKCLEAKIAKLISEQQPVPLNDTDSADISNLIADITPVVEQSYPEDAPQRIFLKEQVWNGSIINVLVNIIIIRR